MKWQAEDFLRLTSRYTVARMLERDDFAKRFRDHQPISLLEFMYPLLQGYDSVAIEADVELGGTDQKFNLLVARHLQREYGQAPQVIIMNDLLEGTDGVQKMSKSLGNYIGIDEEPQEMYGKTMSIPDDLIPRYLELATDLEYSLVKKICQDLKEENQHPMEVKKMLARRLVEMYHGPAAAQKAEEEFVSVFSKGNLPEDILEVEVKKWLGPEGKMQIIPLLNNLGFIASNSEGKRLIKQGALSIDGERINDFEFCFKPEDGMVIRLGKRKFARLLINSQ